MDTPNAEEGRTRRRIASGVTRLLVSAGLILTLAGGCVAWAPGTGPSAPPMPLDEALARRSRGEAVIVDVRARAAFAEGHIPGAISIPEPEIASRGEEIRRLGKLPILYCG
jgi:hypothetical protein